MEQGLETQKLTSSGTCTGVADYISGALTSTTRFTIATHIKETEIT